jgi:hypothetical protein
LGVFLGLIYLGVLGWRCRGLKGADICEAVGLAITPFPLPGAVEMIYKALGSAPLPIFNSTEDRAALIFGGLLLIAAFLYGLFIAGKRALTASPPSA